MNERIERFVQKYLVKKSSITYKKQHKSLRKKCIFLLYSKNFEYKNIKILQGISQKFKKILSSHFQRIH